jgi:hypothetical protein
MSKYAGIGSRETPGPVLIRMQNIAYRLAEDDYILRTGGANGADTAFEIGCRNAGGDIELYLPHKSFNGRKEGYYPPSAKAFEMAEMFHPKWNGLSPTAKLLIARNGHQVLGLNMDDPVDFVVCWTEDGLASGGTGQALRIAAAMMIPVYNLYNRPEGMDVLIGKKS